MNQSENRETIKTGIATTCQMFIEDAAEVTVTAGRDGDWYTIWFRPPDATDPLRSSVSLSGTRAALAALLAEASQRLDEATNT